MKMLFLLLCISLYNMNSQDMLPLYDITTSFEENLLVGPRMPEQIPKRDIPQEMPFLLFGHPISSRIGIAACALTTSKGIALASQLGYDVLTYKTIRSSYSPPVSSHIYYVDAPQQLTLHDMGALYYIQADAPNSYKNLTITNSFGINSADPKTTIDDIARARAALAHGQILIVSIYGSGYTKEECIEDFIKTAKIAAAGGAQVIEANFACPNLGTTQMIYKQPDLVYEICKAIHNELPTIPLTIKVGVFDNQEQMRAVLKAAYHGGARGICGINAIPVQVITHEGDPAFGKDHPVSGLSGATIRELAIQFVKDARALITEEQLDLVLFATGGVIHPQDFDALFEAGADIALSATGAMWNERLAIDYHLKI